MTIRAVRGVHDILPGEGEKWRRVERIARDVFDSYGYEEIRLPIFERTELFAQTIGEATDIVQKEMYTFQDRGGDSVTLRPEATAGLLRAYIEHGLFVHPKPIKLYTMGPMFRYERPQAGRYRQFHQLDVEALGDEHASLDAEVIAMLVEFFRRLDLAQRLQVEINSLGDEKPECRPRYRTELVRYLRANADRLCEECRERIERNPLRVLDCKKPECRRVLDRAPALGDFLCADCAAHFGKTREYLEATGVPHVVSPRLVRGLDYYMRTTFELTTTELGAQNAVAGGGRYDGLIKLLGGPPDPGIGFAVGVERVVQLLPDVAQGAWQDRRPGVFLIPLGDEALRRLLPVAGELRAKGIVVEVGHGERKLTRELERASKLEEAKRLGVLHAVILGPDELARGEAKVKDMKSGAQRAVPLSGLVDELLALGGRA